MKLSKYLFQLTLQERFEKQRFITPTRRSAPFGRLSAREKFREKKITNFIFREIDFFFWPITHLIEGRLRIQRFSMILNIFRLWNRLFNSLMQTSDLTNFSFRQNV